MAINDDGKQQNARIRLGAFAAHGSPSAVVAVGWPSLLACVSATRYDGNVAGYLVSCYPYDPPCATRNTIYESGAGAILNRETASVVDSVELIVSEWNVATRRTQHERK
ncbi:hypothetical protein [Allorhodopirellula solitaria]|uniref:Uncharacterized protein n=1 Tax=Allorhodopirellula solitaria TaxID=2527987 RepID=A0A5C5WLV5_9BACT|nr:hypothetical protein [Allorhodopirellula solitaria]TWT51774.1 hypothetical protein CA85_52000 [Allorhodopirellula solitaria]